MVMIDKMHVVNGLTIRPDLVTLALLSEFVIPQLTVTLFNDKEIG